MKNKGIPKLAFNSLEAAKIAAYIRINFHNIEYSNSISKFKEAI